MKKLIITLFLLLATCHLTPSVSAQSTDTVLVKTTFTTQKEFELIFDNSGTVHYISETSNPTVKPFALSVMSKTQQSSLQSQNLKPTLIASSPDMKQFVYAYHPFSQDSTPLKKYGFVTILDPNTSLIQLQTNVSPHALEEQSDIVVFTNTLEGTIIKPKYDLFTQRQRPTSVKSSYDPNNDGVTNGLDYGLCIRNYFLRGDNLPCDTDGNKKVDSLDLSAVIFRLGKKI